MFVRVYLCYVLCGVGGEKKRLKRSSFYKVWLQTMKDGVVNPETDVHCECYVQKNHAEGFSKCDTCDYIAKKIALARTPEEKETYKRQLQQHHKTVKEDRMEMARVARLCKIDERHVGFMIDAVDKQKFQIPTTQRDTKSLKKICRIVQKITGVLWYS